MPNISHNDDDKNSEKPITAQEFITQLESIIGPVTNLEELKRYTIILTHHNQKRAQKTQDPFAKVMHEIKLSTQEKAQEINALLNRVSFNEKIKPELIEQINTGRESRQAQQINNLTILSDIENTIYNFTEEVIKNPNNKEAAHILEESIKNHQNLRKDLYITYDLGKGSKLHDIMMDENEAKKFVKSLHSISRIKSSNPLKSENESGIDIDQLAKHTPPEVISKIAITMSKFDKPHKNNNSNVIIALVKTFLQKISKALHITSPIKEEANDISREVQNTIQNEVQQTRNSQKNKDLNITALDGEDATKVKAAIGKFTAKLNEATKQAPNQHKNR